MENKTQLTRGMQGKAIITPKVQLVLLGFNLYPDDQNFPTALASGAVSLDTFDAAMEDAVKEFQKRYGLKETGIIDEVTADRLDAEVENSGAFAVVGTITVKDGEPYRKVVTAYDKDLRNEEPLGNSTPNKQGAYAIFYNQQNFLRAEKERADLWVKVFDNAQQELASNEIIFNASHIEIVNFVLEDEQSKNLTECERYNQELQPLLEKVMLRELTHEDIYFLHKETGISLLHLKFLQLDDLHRQSFKVANCLFYGLFRQGLPVNLERLMALDPSQIREAFKQSIGDKIISPKLQDDLELLLTEFQERNLPDKEDVQAFGNVSHLSPEEIKKEHPEMFERLVQIAITDTKDKLETYFKDSSDDLRYYIITVDISEVKGSESIKDFLRRDVQRHKVSQFAVQEGLSKIKDRKGSETLDAVLLPTVPINQNPLFQPQLQQADVFKITGLASLGDAIAQQLAVRNITLHNLNSENIKHLIDENVISETQGRSLQLNANVYALANGNTALATAIKNRNPNEQINSIADLVSLEVDDWKKIFKDAKVEGDEEGIEKKAKVKQKQIEILYPHEVFKVKSAASEVPEVRSLMLNFYTANDQLNFLQLNYDYDSDDIQKINMGNFSESEQETILNNLKTNKRLYSITKDAGDTFRLKDAGLDSIVKIANTSNNDLVQVTGLSPDSGNRIIEDARKRIPGIGAAMGNVVDVVTNPWNDIMGGIGLEPQSYLRGLNGYEEFFGETDFCKCGHCASIISPVAYFVDLMEFLKQHVIYKHFFTTEAKRNSILNPKIRRPDLWTGLKLNCKYTHELVAYLTIINEVLENFIYTQQPGYSDPLPDRNTIENFVYELLSKRSDEAVINSFSQPFHLPLTELEIYLQHFPITRASIAEILLDGVVDEHSVLPKTKLNISAREYNLINESEADNQLFLHDLYKIIPSTGAIGVINLQELLQSMIIERSQFSDLIKTYFVTFISNTERENITIVGRRTEGNLQINVEEVNNLTPGALDRMHRFVRLWKQLDWSINELDKAVMCLHKSYVGSEEVLYNLLPDQIVKLKEFQKTLKINVNDLVSVICDMPIEWIDKRFNLDAFIHEVNDKWTKAILDAGAVQFQHPGYRDEASLTDASNLLHRLLAGLGINDEELFLLIDNLRDFLDMDETTHTFTINAGHLSILYRHSLILKKYKLTVAELFFLIRITPSITENRIIGLSDVLAFTDMISWQRESNYSIAELAIILDEELGEEELTEDPAKMAYTVWSQIQTEQSLLFADTIFSYAEGISEEQSRRIVAANTETLVPADLKKYSVGNLTSLPFAIPDDIKVHLSLEQQTTVVSALINTIGKHLFSTTENISATVLEDIKGIQMGESQRILAENPTIFQLTPDGTDYQLTPEVATSPLSIGIIMPETIWTALAPDEQQELYLNLMRYMQLGAPEFTDRLWVGIAGLTLEQSREIIAANYDIFQEIESDKLYWLSTAFDPSVLIEVPVDIPLSASRAQELLMTKHVSQILPNLLSNNLGVSTAKLSALAKLGEYDFGEAIYVQIVKGVASREELETLIRNLQKLAIWFKDKIFDADTLEFIDANSGGTTELFRIAFPDGYRSPNITHLQNMEEYRWLRKNLEGEPEEIHKALMAFPESDLSIKFTEVAFPNLAIILDTEESVISTLNDLILFPATDADGNTMNYGLKALHKFKKVVELVQYLGIGTEVLPLFISNEFEDLASAVQAVVAAIRTKYDSEEEWENKIGPFEDKIREKKRDALTDYLIHTFRSTLTTDTHLFRTTHDLYNYFLIDTELEGCARTSRVVAGISSLQLYVQRCLMNLEQSEDGTIHVLPTNIPAGEWEWRKNYRVWEANRKVFLYPENYIEPDLRDNKTELFKELESTLLQQEISSQNALDAYSKYMKGFDEIANLKIAGSYHHLGSLNNPTTIDEQADTLHLFGVTSSEPPIYYYRTIKNIYKKEKNPSKYGILYEPWVKLNLQIPVKKVSPIVYNSKLYVFWVEITTRPKNDMVDGTNQFAGYEHKMSVKFSSLQLDGTWQAPQTITLPEFERGEGVIWDPLVENSEFNYWLAYDLVWLRALGSFNPYQLKPIFLREIVKKIRDNHELLNENKIVVPIELGGVTLEPSINIYSASNFKNLLKPKYEQPGYDLKRLHLEPKDGYTLKGYNWERIFPTSFNGFLFLGNSAISELYPVDLFHRTFSIYGFSNVWGNATGDNRFELSGSDLKYLKGISAGSYFISERILKGEEPDSYLDYLSEGQNIITDIRGENNEVASINGALYNVTLDANGDIFIIYQHSNRRESNYILKRLGSTLNEIMARKLLNEGIVGLLDINFQKTLAEKNLPFTFLPDDRWNDAQKAIDKSTPDFEGSLGTYFREIPFHTPFLIANHLNSQNKFADAQRWYHFIFDPTANLMPAELEELETVRDPIERRKMMAKRVWQFIEFRNHTLATWREQLNDQQAIEAYKNDPFNPHAIARLRLVAYMKCITMKYIDNLIDQGDHLFAQDTMESINEGTLLYIMASEILGQRPAELGDCEQELGDETYEGLLAKMRGRECYDFLNEIESSTDKVIRTDLRVDYENAVQLTPRQILGSAYETNEFVENYQMNDANNYSINDNSFGPLVDVLENRFPDFKKSNDNETVIRPFSIEGSLVSFHTSFLKQACLFCIPPNPDLLAYWDRVEDRLFKIRNCMNISGVRRQIPLFAPEIDPRLLVRAKAAGLSLEDVLNSINGDIPPYRFAFLLAKAKEYAGALQGFGSALLGALEKKSGEELALLRMRQQDEVLKVYTSKLRDMEVDAAEAGLQGLLKRQKSIQDRVEYYDNLLGEGLSDLEQAQDVLNYTGYGLKFTSIFPSIAASVGALPPSILGFCFSSPTDGATKSLNITADILNRLGEYALISSNIIGKHAAYHRREQGWKFSLQQSENELKEIEPSLVAAEIRRDISIKSRELHEKSIEQHQETYEYYRDKFTNLGLYTYLSTQLQRMYRESYQIAMTLARMAERAYRFERNDETSVLLDGNYWDASHAGLMAGEKLMNALRRMELRYMETNTRSMEVDQAFSLTQIAPEALINLKTTSTCEFTVPELYFDLFYPGQYRRQVKSARLTIPCITGPYSNVSAVMTLKGSYIRKDPKLDTEDSSGLTLVPPSRSTTVATSTAQNDSGVFKLDFRDERYMPFEGAGAVESTWQIELPKSLRPFDYSTINDVLLHISYTAEYSIQLREEVEVGANNIEDTIFSDGFTLPRVFSLRQEFSQGFHQLLHSEAGTIVAMELGEKHFPLFLQGKHLAINSAKLIIELDEKGFITERGIEIPESLSLQLDIQGNVIDDWQKKSGINLIDVNVPPLIGSFFPLSEPLTINMSVVAAGDFTPSDPTPSDPSALDDHKIKDIYLLLNYRVINI